MTRSWRAEVAAGVALCLAMVGLWAYGRYVGPLPGERRAAEWALDHRATTTPGLFGSYQFFAGAAAWPVALVTVLLATVAVARNVGPGAALLVPLAAGATALGEGFSHLAPQTELRRLLSGPAAGTGFPSGHVTYAAGVFGALAVIGRRHGRPEVTLVCVLLVLGMCAARVLDTAHLPGEVLGGLCLGLGWLAIADGLLRRRG